ncbi:PilW family protein [Litorivivens sp.]|uniref:PilW family protein n=1 Tax=Litorivivens sp. TaxID=2020868 RepID=UPI003561E413
MTMRYRKTQSGFGLVELMIAITLGLVLSAALVQVFVATRSSYRVQEALAQIQASSRYAMHFMGKDIRMAGYHGCASIDSAAPNNWAVDTPDDYILNENTMIVGYDNLGATNQFNAVPGTDAITVRLASADSARLEKNMDASNANIQVWANAFKFDVGDIVMITDCVSSDIFRITSMSKDSGGSVTISHSVSTNGNTQPHLSKSYSGDAQFVAVETVHYFIRDTGRTTSDGEPIHALYVQRRKQDSQGGALAPAELVEGIENMQITYGEDTNNTGAVDTYVDAASVTAWGNVKSVRIELLVASQEENVVGQTGSATEQRLRFNGQDVNNTDGRYRAAIKNVFTIRNRVR